MLAALTLIATLALIAPLAPLAPVAPVPALVPPGPGARVAAGPAGDAFTDLPYEQAASHAAETGRFFLVDATAVWCGPCKRMEGTSWKDAAVLAWLRDKAIAVQVDVDKQQGLAADLRIRAMPTLIMFRDGEELDRVVGFRDAEGLLSWFSDVELGKRNIDRERSEAESAEDAAQVETRFSLAKTLSNQGDFDEALEHYEWLWVNAAALDPPWGGVRRSFLLSAVARQADEHDRTREVFTGHLDVLGGLVREPGVGFDAWADWLALARAFGQQDRLIALYEERRASDGSARNLPDMVREELFEALLAADRAEEAAASLGDVESLAQKAIEFDRTLLELEQRTPVDQRATLRQYRESRLRGELARLAAVAGATGQDESSRAVAALLFESLDDARTRVELVEQALRFGWADARHARWLDELERDGADVAALRERLMQLVPRDG